MTMIAMVTETQLDRWGRDCDCLLNEGLCFRVMWMCFQRLNQPDKVQSTLHGTIHYLINGEAVVCLWIDMYEPRLCHSRPIEHLASVE